MYLALFATAFVLNKLGETLLFITSYDAIHSRVLTEMKLVSACALSIILLSFLFSCSSQGLSGSIPITSFGTVKPNRLTYFQCTFSQEGLDCFKLYQSWARKEPCAYPNEKGVWHWINCGPDWGTIRLVPDPADPSRVCAEMVLDAPGTRPLSTNQHVKVYEVQGREAANYTEHYQTSKEAYYQTTYWFPADFRVEPKSWRLIWQLCGEEGIYGNPEHTYYPQLALIFGNANLRLKCADYYYGDGQARSFELISNANLPKERWVPIVVYVKQGSNFRSEDGTVIVWIDGVKVLERHDISTSTYSGTPHVIWGIGNYGGKYEAQGQSIYIKDVVVTSEYTGS